ncbi:MAG: Trm112 family protein [candidate division Zixibacteria bacterium]|nr:Trm112 family protein [candidate division Zixibacteria bacterium]
MLNDKLLEILACPKCKGDLEYDKDKNVLLCNACRLMYRIEEGDIPVMLIDEAEGF